MTDIFISYASEDRSRVEPLAKALEDQGWSVWWDPQIPPGKTFFGVIKEALEAAKCVVVLWSEHSINSEWVLEEANNGKRRGILVPAKIDSVDPPLGFGLIQAADLTDWGGDTSHSVFLSFLSAISDIVGPPPQQEKGDQVADIPESGFEQETELQPEEQKIPQPSQREPETSKIKPAKPKSDSTATTESKSHEPGKQSKALKFGIAGSVVVLLVVGIWWWASRQQVDNVWQTLEKLNRHALNLENAVAELNKVDQIEEFTKQRDTLRSQVAALREQASEAGMELQLKQLQNHLKLIQIQFANKEKELIAARKGKIFVVIAPDNATVKILNIDEAFHQGIELKLGKYHMQAEAEGYETQERWIELGPGEEKEIRFELARKTIINSFDMKFVLIPAGSFTMGSHISPEEVARKYGGEPGEYRREQPPHPVKITKPYYMQTTELTQKQWKLVMGADPYYLGDIPAYFKDCGDDCPVEGIIWDDAQKFIKALNQREGINKYRVPTEAEWEYACRAGTTTIFSFGNETDKLGEYAWYSDNSMDRTHPVGKKLPNAWGLYDMHGNVSEWCQDGLSHYPSNEVSNPKGAWIGLEGVLDGVLRGGSYSDGARNLRSAMRERGNLVRRFSTNGFRVARDF